MKTPHVISVVRPGSSARRGAQGFTLVELLVTLFVAAIMIAAVNTAVNAQAAAGQKHRDMVIANAFINTKVEDLRSQGFLTLTNGTTDLTSQLPSELKSPRSASQVISTHSTSIKKVDISVTYNERGVARTYNYTTLIGELGVGQY